MSQRIAVIGAGTIGASWAAIFLARGHDVAASDPSTNGDSYFVTVYAFGFSLMGRSYVDVSNVDVLFGCLNAFFLANADAIPWTVCSNVTLTNCRVFGAPHNAFAMIGNNVSAIGCEVWYGTNDGGGFTCIDARVVDASNPSGG